jgi:hypothetical protein
MTDALAIYGQFDQMKGAAIALYKSGFFKDTTSEAQAIVKIMAGAELGLPPFASMTGINIIQGKPTLGANVIATLVKNDPRYNYRVKVCDNKICTLEWYEGGKRVGESTFTMQEAQDAGLTTKDNWRKYPSDMLFARAISRGARRFAPGIFGGSPVYTPEEMGADVDPEGYVDTTVTEVATPRPAEVIAAELGYETQAQPTNGNARPYSPAALFAKVDARSKYHAGKIAPDRLRKAIASALDATFDGDKTKRYELCKWLTKEASTKNIPDAYIWALSDWLGVTDFDQPPHVEALTEAHTALGEALKAAGQQELL